MPDRGRGRWKDASPLSPVQVLNLQYPYLPTDGVVGGGAREGCQVDRWNCNTTCAISSICCAISYHTAANPPRRQNAVAAGWLRFIDSFQVRTAQHPGYAACRGSLITFN